MGAEKMPVKMPETFDSMRISSIFHNPSFTDSGLIIGLNLYVPLTWWFNRNLISLLWNPFLCLMRRKFLALPICPFDRLTDPQFPPHSKPWNPNSSSRASKTGCRISHIIKKASIPEASAARLATNPQNRGEVGAQEKFQHWLQNRVSSVRAVLSLPSTESP